MSRFVGTSRVIARVLMHQGEKTAIFKKKVSPGLTKMPGVLDYVVKMT